MTPRGVAVALWLAAALPPPQVAAAQDAREVLDRAARAYDTVRTLAAAFVQEITNPMLGDPETTRGRLYLERPSHFAMVFTAPAGDRVVADGRALWLYTPSSTPGQVLKLPVPHTGTTGPNLIGQFVEGPDSLYVVRPQPSATIGGRPCDGVLLRPKRPGLPFETAVIWVDREDGTVRRIEIREGPGQVRRLTFSEIALNQPIPRYRFSFSPPPGVRVVEQGG